MFDTLNDEQLYWAIRRPSNIYLLNSSQGKTEFSNVSFVKNEIENLNTSLVELYANTSLNLKKINFSENKVTFSDKFDKSIENNRTPGTYSHLAFLLSSGNNNELIIDGMNIENNVVNLTYNSKLIFDSSLVYIHDKKTLSINDLNIINNKGNIINEINEYSSALSSLMTFWGEQDDENDYSSKITNLKIINNFSNYLLYFYSYKFDIENAEISLNTGFSGLRSSFNESKNIIKKTSFKNNNFIYAIVDDVYVEGTIEADNESLICGNNTNLLDRYTLTKKNAMGSNDFKIPNNVTVRDEC